MYNIYKNVFNFLLKTSMVKNYKIMYYNYIRKLIVSSFEKLGRNSNGKFVFKECN